MLAIALAAWLIPVWGAIGAAVAVAVAMASPAPTRSSPARQAFPLPFPSGAVIRILAACAVMALIVRLRPGITIVDFACQVVDGGLAYGLTAFALDVLGARRRAFGLG
ncbi:MAG: polysaccharide biosynthesis C-terminal domain-containing protein [Aliidongia sp.]